MSCSRCNGLFPDNDRRSIHYPFDICTPKTHICTRYLACCVMNSNITRFNNRLYSCHQRTVKTLLVDSSLDHVALPTAARCSWLPNVIHSGLNPSEFVSDLSADCKDRHSHSAATISRDPQHRESKILGGVPCSARQRDLRWLQP